MTKQRVLFLCTANSARSQMAEVLLRQHAGELFEVLSAGSQPDSVDPRTLAALQQLGLPTEGLHSKGLDEVIGQPFDFVISLCDKASRECELIPNAGEIMHWHFPDPKERAEPDPFLLTLQEINARIRLFVQIQDRAQRRERPRIPPVTLFKSLADATRLRLLLLIQAENELCVCELTEALDDIQPKVSRHLNQLKKNGLLQDRRQGQWVYYRLDEALPDWVLGIIAEARRACEADLDDDRARLQAMSARPRPDGRCAG